MIDQKSAPKNNAVMPRELAAYQRLITEGVLEKDPAQREVAELFAQLSNRLNTSQNNNGIAGFLRRRREAPKGLYLWGGVGQGKSLLMDLFYSSVSIAHKRRVHFHEFMDEIHQNFTKIRANSTKSSGHNDAIGQVVKPIIKNVRLLCFDEFHVSDITNAMLLGRIFEKFFAAGMVVVATSNVPPDELYKDGLNRDLFLPFVDLLKQRCEVKHLHARTDYRMDRLSSQPVFYFGAKEQVAASMDQLWLRLAGEIVSRPGQINVLGRKIAVPAQAMGAARFDFADLFEQPLGARDYLAISHEFHTLMIDNIPRFDRDNSNEAKRFILAIDTFYDHGVKLAASFTVPVESLSNDRNTAFEFKRTASRLAEMRSDAYLAAPRHLDG